MRTLEELQKYIEANSLKYILGIDEVGLGAIAGELTLAYCVMAVGDNVPGLKDSKKLSDKARSKLVPVLRDRYLHATASAPPEYIDRVGVTAAKAALMHQLLDKHKSTTPKYLVKHTLVVIDGADTIYDSDMPVIALVKADNLVPAVSAAANIAKYHRDGVMRQLHNDFPQYGWDKNVGYPTPAHIKAVAQHGRCIHHRNSYRVALLDD